MYSTSISAGQLALHIRCACKANCYSAFVLRMHAEVDNEEGSTIFAHIKVAMPSKIFEIMHNIETTQWILTR